MYGPVAIPDLFCMIGYAPKQHYAVDLSVL